MSIPWLHESLGFYAVPGDFRLAQSPSFRSGRIYGMDVSSGAAVAALLSDQHDCSQGSRLLIKDFHVKKSVGSNATQVNSMDQLVDAETETQTPGSSETPDSFRVLDLCCSPGLKLCTIADLISMKYKESVIVGVDVSEHRISLCKKIVKKYHVDAETSGQFESQQHHEKVGDRNMPSVRARIRLYCEDGRTFGTRSDHRLMFDSQVAAEDCHTGGKRKRMNKSARARERKRLRQLMNQSVDMSMTPKECKEGDHESDDHCSVCIKLFDRVLVDAECSTDGSLKHVQQSIIRKTAKSVVGEASNRTIEAADIPTLSNSKLTDAAQLEKLVQLQRELIVSGFRLLKPGASWYIRLVRCPKLKMSRWCPGC